ncbi:MAG: tubulin-like doman-containing protein, partial [Chloroflexota bacterium]
MTTEIRFEPTLFLFLGTSPGQIGWRIKDLLRRAYGDIPILRFLWVDADSTVDPFVASWFKPGERAELVGFNGDAVLTHLANFSAIQAWWPRDSRLKAGYINRGAGQMRPIGRLALFRMYNDRNAGPAFIDRLRAATEAIQQIGNIDATEQLSNGKTRFVVERGSVRVVIVFSTCGGTGSSMAYDIAYLCRHLLKEANPNIVSVALLPSILDKAIKNETYVQRERIRANTYAWFKEGNYLIENPNWRVQYPEGAAINLQAPPFDMNFVVELGNQAGNRLNSEDDIFNMIASAIFLDTGSSIGGAIRGFNANVSVLLEEFQGRRRAYSSLAAASLVYPAEKILSYCSARLGQRMMREISLAQSDAREVKENALAILGRLRLKDAQLLEDLLADQQLGGMNLPAIRKAGDIEQIRRLLSQQEESDAKDREGIKARIAERSAALLAQAENAIRAEISRIAIERGIRFAQAILDEFCSVQPNMERATDSSSSFVALKAHLSRQGISEAGLAQVEQSYRQARDRLRGMAGDPLRVIQRLLFRKSWQEGINRARNDCLTWMAEVNRQTLQWYAQREATGVYEQMADQARTMKLIFAGARQSVERAVSRLEDCAAESLKPATAEEGIYELAIEALGADYTRHFYERSAISLTPPAVYREFVAKVQAEAPAQVESWSEGEWARRVQDHARQYFVEPVENTSLLEALSEFYGEKAAKKTEGFFDRLVRYCHPFWQYDTNSGIQGQEGKSIIGVEDEHSELIPPRYQQDPQYEIKSTGFKH